VGVLLPRAPDGFSGTLVRGGRPTSPVTFGLDMLWQPDDWLRSRGLRVPSRAERRAVGRRIARIGALFEDAELVSNWSHVEGYVNVPGQFFDGDTDEYIDIPMDPPRGGDLAENLAPSAAANGYRPIPLEFMD